MKWFERFRYRTFSQTASVEELLVEVFRKTIHLSSALTVVFAEHWYTPTIVAIVAITLLYCISEFFRMRGRELWCIASITRHASRSRDKGKFVLGPLTLAGGVLAALLLFPIHTAKIAVFALAFGDGLASLIGKRFGKIKLRKIKFIKAFGKGILSLLFSRIFRHFPVLSGQVMNQELQNLSLRSPKSDKI